MTGDRRRMLTGIFLGAAVGTFSLAVTLNAAAAMPAASTTVHAAQAGLSQVEKAQVVVGPRGGVWRRGPAWRGGVWRGRGPIMRGRRVCFFRFGRRVCVWR
jgi:hypothetical protein